jgi:hypothetical protein
MGRALVLVEIVVGCVYFFLWRSEYGLREADV